jgi:NAD(P)-dependent dehydrogenase (short-subunit alcohol dehydrogenase family)
MVGGIRTGGGRHRGRVRDRTGGGGAAGRGGRGRDRVRRQRGRAGGDAGRDPGGWERRHLVPVDVTSQDQVDRLVDDAVGRHGRVDLLANVAGIMDWFLPAHEVDDETWFRVMAVNVNGPMMVCRKVLPGMLERGAGAIVNVASVAGLRGGGAGMTRSIAWTYRGDGIRCNAICPGGVQTNIGTTAVPRSQFAFERLGKSLALAEKAADPDEIAALASWLASDEASNVNGAIVTADGGWTAG